MSDAQPGTLPALDEPGDAELISAVRAGDLDAYGTLFARHVEAARRLARQLVSAGDVDDLVSEAFSKVLGVLQKGGGPDLAFRAYLLTSLRRLHVDKLRASARLTTTDDMTAYDPGVPFEDTAVAGFDNQAAAKAFSQLPERWQQVLWHTEVEGQKPAEIAPLLGMTPNSVSALAYRAREGLRQAFISMHAQDAADDACSTTRANLGAYIRSGLSKRDSTKVEGHLQDCRPCTAIYLELTEVNSNLGALLAPLLLGSAGAAYLAAAGTGAKVGFLLLLGRGKDWVLHNPAGRATAGVAAAAVVAAGVAVAAQGGHHPPTTPQADRPQATSAQTSQQAPPPAAPAATKSKPKTQPKTQTPPPATPPTDTTTPTTTPPPTSPAPSPTKQPEKSPVIKTPVPDVTVTPGGSVVIDLTNGATDPNGDPLTVKSASVAKPAHGTVRKGGRAGRPTISGGGRSSLSGSVPLFFAKPSAGVHTVTYTADEGWRGTDTIDYTLSDGHGGTVSGSVEVTTPNAPPVAKDDTEPITIINGPVSPDCFNVLRNDSDANKDPLHLVPTSITRPQHGTVTASSDGEVCYTRDFGFSGDNDSFAYTVSDGHGGTSTATVTLKFDTLVTGDAGVSASTATHTDSNGNPFEHLFVSTSVPLGEKATLTFGFDSGGAITKAPGESWDSPCGTQTPVAVGEKTSCTVTDGATIHLDFNATRDWHFTATIKPQGFTDTDPADNTAPAGGKADPPAASPTPSTSPSGGSTSSAAPGSTSSASSAPTAPSSTSPSPTDLPSATDLPSPSLPSPTAGSSDASAPTSGASVTGLVGSLLGSLL